MKQEPSDWMQTLTGAQISIRTPGSQTDGRLTIIDFIEPPLSKPPVFTRHEFIEVFSVISGRLSFQCLHEAPRALCAGDSVACASYQPHSFWNEMQEPVHIQLVCSPAGLDQFFIESDALLKTAGLPTDHTDKLCKALRAKYGLEHVGTAPAASR